MKHEDFLQFHAKAAADKRIAGCAIADKTMDGELHVMVHPETKEPTLVVANAYQVTETKTGEVHNVYTYFDGKGLHISCDDQLVNGRNTDIDNILTTALKNSPLDPAQHDEVRRTIEGNLMSRTPDPACFFEQSFPAGELCRHTAKVLAEEGLGLWNAMESAWDVRVSRERANELGNSTKDFIAEYAFQVPVLLEGERGQGKTYGAREFAKENGLRKVEVGLHAGTEATDLLGYLRPTPTGPAWTDGPVAEAFRAASRGEKTLLILDELLRVRPTELSLLLTALSPDGGQYHLRTGRVKGVDADGVGGEEVISAPISKLAIVATTNVGAEYSVSEMDPAIAERFIPTRVELTRAEMALILGGKAEEKGMPGKEVAEALLSFRDTLQSARDQGQLAMVPTMRTLARPLELSKTVADIPRHLSAQSMLWAERDSHGKALEEQVSFINKAASKSFEGLAPALPRDKSRGGR